MPLPFVYTFLVACLPRARGKAVEISLRGSTYEAADCILTWTKVQKLTRPLRQASVPEHLDSSFDSHLTCPSRLRQRVLADDPSLAWREA